MRRIARHTGGKVVTDMSDLEGNEVFDVESLGSAEEVSQEVCQGHHRQVTLAQT